MAEKSMKTRMNLFAVLLCAVVAANVYALMVKGAPVFQMLTSVGLLITAGFGAVYLFTGFTKEKSAKFFVCFMAMYTVTEALGILGAKSLQTVNVLLLVLSFACAFTLTVAKDLGKTKSYVLSVTIILSVIARLGISYFSGKLPVFGIRPLSKLILGLTVLVLVSAKYYDKKTRYAKTSIAEQK